MVRSLGAVVGGTIDTQEALWQLILDLWMDYMNYAPLSYYEHEARYMMG